MASARRRLEVDFPTFFHLWAEHQGWKAPLFHYRVARWLEERGDDAVLMIFRGAGKSTMLGVYNAWRYYRDPTYRILHRGSDDRTAYKTARDTKAVLRRHPLTRGMGDIRGEVSFWWVPGAIDERNPSMQAAGVLSNTTSSRADEAQNDDVEVPRNSGTAEARESIRARLAEQTHILVPGARTLYVGTPHAFDSIYEERIKGGADVLRIPLYAQECRDRLADADRFPCEFRPDVVFVGIHRGARSVPFEWRDGEVTLAEPVTGVVDAYAGCAWPERFTALDILKRRRDCRTINEWDSQYQLHARPIGDSRLDPDQVGLYNFEPQFRLVNGETLLTLGGRRMVSATLKMDPASGKVGSDVSALCLVFQDATGGFWWHRAIALEGELAKFGPDRKIIGGQVAQICDVVEGFALTRVLVETNGIGGHVPTLVIEALRQRGLDCGVTAQATSGNKQRRILAAFEPALQSGLLNVHESVWERVATQFVEWRPDTSNQPDDYLDAAAGAMLAEPVRIGRPAIRQVRKRTGPAPDNWMPESGVHEVTFER